MFESGANLFENGIKIFEKGQKYLKWIKMSKVDQNYLKNYAIFNFLGKHNAIY